MCTFSSGRGAARLARLHGVQEVGGSNPLAPTEKETPEMESFGLTNLPRNVILSEAKNLYPARSQIALFQKRESAICDHGHYI